ncbi:MAG: type IX secretion system membrane protein PorP/SprF [Bacteroidetes bacterium]|nr:type IX secretion system membrane protein PorP/SprF [Bacteroidota bacterium]MCL2303157.1 type IX secretion system membrane protein PorP/SprF [Lentimicrobiaceae bacterium]
MKLKKKKVIFVHTKMRLLMRMKYCFIFLFLFFSYKLTAQEDPRFTFSPWLQSFYNPGAMGEKDQHLNFTGVLRQHAFMMREPEEADPSGQGESDSSTDPTKPTYRKQNGEQVLLNIESYIKQIRGAVGISFMNDKVAGVFENVGFRFGYATKFRVHGGKLGVGLQFGFLNSKPGKNYPFNPNQDPDPLVTAIESSESFLDFDMNFGIHYKAPTWYAGISCAQLLGGARISGGESGFKTLHPVRQIYMTGGYIWDLKTPVPWSIEPHVFIRTNLATWTMDVMALARYNGILWFGLSYQLDWAVAVLFGAVPFYNSTNNYLKGLELGLSYSFPTNKLGYRTGGSMGDFEILVRYGFNFYKDKALTGYGSSRHLYKNQY